ncbi:MAG: hypothetical protein ACJ8F7_19850 [Gemmataceae bacterium]
MPPLAPPRFHRADEIDLYFDEQPLLAVQATSGPHRFDLRVCQLICNVRFPGCRANFPAKIDQAAYITVIPKPRWQQMTGVAIEWLSVPPSAPPCWSSIAGISGHRIPCRLGAVWAYAVDYRMRCLPAVHMIALFVQGDIREDHILIGLTHGLLDDRYIISKSHPDATRRQAWLTTQAPIPPAGISVS